MNKILLSIILFLTIATNGLAQQQIIGRVVDEKGIGLEYVNVVLLSLPDSTFLNGTVTGADGTFKLACESYDGLLRLSSIGYRTLHRTINATNAGTISLSIDEQILSEIVVKGNYSGTRLKGDAMVTNVAGTLLEKAGTAENLLDKIPGVSAGDGKVNVFGRGSAVVYINGREIRDDSELDRLSSDNIKSVEVVSNPGARYSASVKAVVRIITKKAMGEGFSFNNRLSGSYNDHWSWIEQFNFNYRRGNFDLLGSLYGQDGRSQTNSKIIQDTYIDKHYKQDMHIKENEHYQSLGGVLGMNYVIKQKHSLGVYYRWGRMPKYNTNSGLLTDVIQNKDLVEKTSSLIKGGSQSTNHNINLYYQGKVGAWIIDFNADVLWNTKDRQSNVNEIGILGADDRIVSDYTKTENKLYAGKLIVMRSLLGGQVSIGSEYVHTSRTNDYLNNSGLIENAVSKIEENSTAVFLEFGRTLNKVELKAGLRYEHVGFDYYEDGKLCNEQSKKFDNLFPSFSLSSPLGDKIQMQASYRIDITRPSYQQLRGNMQYANRYTYESGNPLLQPSLTHNAQISFTYNKWLMFRAFYQHIEDAFIWSSHPYSEDNPTIAVLNLQNAKAYNNMTFHLYASHKFGIWLPKAGVGYQKQWYQVDTPEGHRSLHNPLWILETSHDFQLPGGILLTAKASWYTHHHSQNTEIIKNDWNMRVILYKGFMNDRLNFQIYANDIFNSSRSEIMTYFGSLRTMWKRIEPNSRSISLTVRYKFNSARSKYKGTGAGTSQKERM